MLNKPHNTGSAADQTNGKLTIEFKGACSQFLSKIIFLSYCLQCFCEAFLTGNQNLSVIRRCFAQNPDMVTEDQQKIIASYHIYISVSILL